MHSQFVSPLGSNEWYSMGILLWCMLPSTKGATGLDEQDGVFMFRWLVGRGWTDALSGPLSITSLRFLRDNLSRVGFLKWHLTSLIWIFVCKKWKGEAGEAQWTQIWFPRPTHMESGAKRLSHASSVFKVRDKDPHQLVGGMSGDLCLCSYRLVKNTKR